MRDDALLSAPLVPLVALTLILGLATCARAPAAPDAFRLLEFPEAGLADVPRNRALSLRFTRAVALDGDFAAAAGVVGADGRRALGTYFVDGERLTFVPRLPRRPDRADAGLRADETYVIALRGGPGGLRAADGASLETDDRVTFATGRHFEDVAPLVPPRATGWSAIAPGGAARELSRPADTSADADSHALVAAGLALPPEVAWSFEVAVSEPLDPATVTADAIALYEVAADATTTPPGAPPDAPPGHRGTPVLHRVPVQVELVPVVGGPRTAGARIRVTPRQRLTDDTRHRLSCSGRILGLDFRDGSPASNGLGGGVGASLDFLVADGPVATGTRTIAFAPAEDGVQPERGQSEADPARYNSALYDPATAPGRAVGVHAAFGDGADGDLHVAAGEVLRIDTGDVANDASGNPFAVLDPNPDDDYLGDPRPGRTTAWDSPRATELRLRTLHVAAGGTIFARGVNPLCLRVAGAATVAGVLDASGGAGGSGGGIVAPGGAAGPGGFAGGGSAEGASTCAFNASRCSDFASALAACTALAAGFPFSRNGAGPGRGLAGGEAYVNDFIDDRDEFSGTGGGGGGHATAGTDGEDRRNAGGEAGTPGPACATRANVRNAGVLGVRGRGGVAYGDADVVGVTVGGSGGGAGGAVSAWGPPKQQAGGGGGGGGGSIELVALGPVRLSGALLARGGDGGAGAFKPGPGAGTSRISVSGGGGGGAGGTLVVISADHVDPRGGRIDAGGGAGGTRADAGRSPGFAASDAGGDGGDGFVLLMDADGAVPAPDVLRGVATTRAFEPSRFQTVAAVTELFLAGAASPRYEPLAPDDVDARVGPGQSIRLLLSTAPAQIDDPARPDLARETPPVSLAEVVFAGGAVRVDVVGQTDPTNLTDATGTPDPSAARHPFARLRAEFAFADGAAVRAAPPEVRAVTLRFRFNGDDAAAGEAKGP